MVFVVFRLSDTSADWRMMAHLFSEVCVINPFQLKSFAENWIEWLIKSTISALVLGNAETSYKLNSYYRIFLHICLSQKVLVFHNLGNLLNHTYRFVKVNRHTEPC